MKNLLLLLATAVALSVFVSNVSSTNSRLTALAYGEAVRTPESLPTDLFISEYVEGSSSNQAIEIYNATASAINLGTGAYVVQVYRNGSTTPSTSTTLTGTIAAGGTYVIANNLAVLGITPNLSTANLNFNGNDAVVLRKGGVGGTILDVIGQIGNDPGANGWGTDPANTLDNTIRRKSTICTGDANGSDTFIPAGEWNGFPLDTFSGLGSHTVACTNEPDFSILQFPGSLSLQAGTNSGLIYGQVYEATVTEPPGANVNVAAQVGYGPSGSDPRGNASWTWFTAAYNVQVGNNDEYQGSFTAPVPGNYSFTYRFSLDGGTNWSYADRDGNSNGGSFSASQLGTMTTTIGPPTVITNAASSVGTAAATLNGSAIPNGQATTGWFRYSATNPGTCNDTFGTRAPSAGGTALGSGTSSVAYNQSVSGLSAGTTYYVCAIASNSVGTSFGDLVTFNTAALPITFTVTTGVDEQDGSCADGDCSLRDAVELANASSGNDEVLIPESIGNITLGGSEVVIQNNGTLRIAGFGANRLTVGYPGTGAVGTSRIFYSVGATVTISGMTLTGGNGAGAAAGEGGAVYADGGSITLSNVHITGNTAVLRGGGAFFNGGSHAISNSACSANVGANEGGCVASSSATVAVTNSTVTGNTVTGVGGAFSIPSGNLSLTGSTVSNNNGASIGGGVFISGGTVTLRSSIVAGNTATSGRELFVFSGGFLSGGFNLVGDSAGDSTDTGGPLTYLTSDKQNVNPMFGTFGDHGGSTPTLPLLAGSPAVDAGSAFGSTIDQRGAPRTVNHPGVIDASGSDGTDIGAFELLAPTAAGASLGGRVTAANGVGIRGALVTVEGGPLRGPLPGRTNAFGYYRLDGLPAGHVYTVTVGAKGFRFGEPSRVVSLGDSLAGVDFAALPE
jgi:CSLREA domain-containing protein